MKSRIRIVWLKNHGVRIVTDSDAGTATRFEPHAGSVTVTEAAAAFGTYPWKIYRRIEAGLVKSRARAGVHRIAVAELWRLKRTPDALADGRTLRKATA